MKYFFVFLLVFLSSAVLNAQYFSTGQDPASVKWKQIKTDRFKIIFPDNFEQQSQYLANIIDILSQHETSSLKAKVPSIPILLHTKSTTSNGVTVWAPKRIELYPNPPQDAYAEEWLEQLAIHEYRHTVQISKMNQGFTKVLYYIFGEQITGGVLGLYVPPWFLEGDATVTETALSNAGRGRTPAFENVLRAQLLEKGIFSYDKEVLGSYKDFTPDAYELGYPFVAQVRKKYGKDVWNAPLDKVAKLPFMVVPFSSGIKKATGKTKVQLYKETMSDLKSEWETQDSKIPLSEIIYITKRNPKNYTHYVHPVFKNDTIIVAEKESNEDVDWIISINRLTGKEKKLVAKGYGFDESLSVSGDLVTWSEWEPDERWRNRDFSVIRIYDFSKDKDRYLTHRSRYFAPALSPGSDKVSAVRTDDQNNSYIDILDVNSGKVIDSYPVPEKGFAETPVWSPDGEHLIFVLLTEKGKTVAELDLPEKKIKTFLPFSFRDISGPAYYQKQFVIFSADYSGISDLYTLDTVSKQIFQVISSKFSSSDPDFTADRTRLTFLNYTSDGFMIAETSMDSVNWKPLEKVADNSTKLAKLLSGQEKVNIQDTNIRRNLYKILQGKNPSDINQKIEGKIYPVKNYSKLTHLFNPHSWAPASIDINNLTLNPGVSIMSQNILSTMFATAGYEYNVNDREGKFFGNISYQGFYPVFDIRFDYGKRRGYYHPAHSSEIKEYRYWETNLKATARVPLNFSKGRILRFLQPSFGSTYIFSKPADGSPSGLKNHSFQTLDYRLYFSESIISNPKDEYPRLGQIIDFNFRNTPFGTTRSSILAVEGNLYFRGFFNHHGFWLYGAYQHKEQDTQSAYSFSDIISYPRGITDADDENLYSFFLNYKFPLWYPDFSAGPVFYFKRISLNLFMDYAEGKNGTTLNVYRSTGAELTTDLHILRFVYPFELGLRTVYLPDKSSWSFEFLYSVSF